MATKRRRNSESPDREFKLADSPRAQVQDQEEETSQPARVWRAASNSRLTDKDATIVGPYLEEMARRLGTKIEGVKPQQILEDARRPDSPLHSYFEWDETKAAYQYNLMQARYLARSVRLEITLKEDNRPRTYRMPGLVSIQYGPKQNERTYIPVGSVLTNSDHLAKAKADALRMLITWKERYKIYAGVPEFAELKPIFDAIESLSEKAA